MYKEMMTSLANRNILREEQVAFFLEQVKLGKLNIAQQAAVLSGIQVKGIDAKELAVFAKLLLQEASEKLSFPEAIDICGTGGSGLPRINTSTISAFILSALGVPVAKHGNKAASGRFGSFDLLEALGINIELGKEELDRIAQQLGLNFIYARTFHPAMKHFAAVRNELGIPTVFNLLGPLLNPAQPKMQIIGTSFRHQMRLIVETAKKLGKKRVMVVCGEDGLDEVTLTGKTFVVELRDGKVRNYTLRPSSFGIKHCEPKDIQGGDSKKNIQLALDILQGTCKSRHLDLVLVNTSLALKLAGKTSNLKKAYQLAKNCLLSGKAYHQLLAYRQASKTPAILLDIVNRKKNEVSKRKQRLPLKKFQKRLKPSDRSFRSALLGHGVSLIAEIKKASPSEGRICKGSFNVQRIAQLYEQSGARAISVLTDEHYFKGALENLSKAREATKNTPLLCKDFIIDEYQIYEARHFGANAVLLIAAILTKDEVKRFLEVAESLKMDALCEVHDEEELAAVLEAGAEIIGINNRDLNSFKVDLKTTERLARKIPANIVVVSESGISTRRQVRKLPGQVDAILVGTSLLKSKNIRKKIEELIGKPKPLLKICGVRSVEEAQYCQKLGVDLIGLNFVPSSDRRISYQLGAQIVQALKMKKSGIKTVGIFQNQSLTESNTAAEKVGFDYMQLSGDEPVSVVKQSRVPVIKGISVKRKSDLNKARRYFPFVRSLLLDSKNPGSGESFRHDLLKGFELPYFLAGGVTPENARETMSRVHPAGLDVASGIETDGKIDIRKIRKIFNAVKS